MNLPPAQATNRLRLICKCAAALAAVMLLGALLNQVIEDRMASAMLAMTISLLAISALNPFRP